MCPFRVLVILFSLLIALFATMAALAKDPDEDEEEAQRLSGAAAAPKSLWFHFVDFWTGRYLYRETKRLMPFMFAKDAPPTVEVEEQDNSALGEASDAAAVDQEEHLLTAQAELAAQSPVPEPSAPAPEADAEEQQKQPQDADAAFERASLKHRQPRLHEMGIVGVIS